MKINPRYFPHPVLSCFSEDFLNSWFESNISIVYENNVYKININFELDNNGIKRMVRNKEVIFAIHIECSKTRFRKIYTCYSNEMILEIPENNILGKVQVCSFILAADKIDSYQNENFNPDYGKSQFSLAKGDIIAIGRNKEFSAEKNYNLSKEIPSIFIITKNKEKNSPAIDFYFDERIIIKLSEDNYNNFSYLSGTSKELPYLLSSLIVVPTLAAVLEQLNGNDKAILEFEDTRWFKVIKNRLKQMGVELKEGLELNRSSIDLASQLLGNPLNSSFKFIENIMNER